MNRNSPSPSVRALAQRLLAHESTSRNPPQSHIPALLCVIEKLRRPLSMLAGSSGFASLLARALTLAKADTPRLGALEVKQDGSLEGFDSADEDTESCIILIAQLLELLVTFIGEPLVFSLVLDSWPDLAGIHSLEKEDDDPTR